MDPIADMLTRIRNASKTKKADVFIPFSKIKLEIAKVLKKEGYIKGYEEIKPDKGSIERKFGGIVIQLKYENDSSVITSIDRISKPGRRVYTSNDKMPKVLNGLGVAIVTTSRGVMTDRQAKANGLGGEILCQIY